MSNPLADDKLPLLEIYRYLDQILRLHPASRLLVDMARDAITEAIRQHSQLLAALRQSRRKRRQHRRQRAELLDALLASGWPIGATSPYTDDEPPTLVAHYQTLRETIFPEQAKQLQAVSQRGEPRDFLRVLSERILLRGQRTLAEALLRKPRLDDRTALRSRLGQHLLGRLCRHLTRRFGCTLDTSVRAALGATINEALALIERLLLTRETVLRLLWPPPGTIVDSQWHERLGGKASHSPRRVQAVLFPGLIKGTPASCLVRALVATQR
ncbi:MAG: hypothetical protein SNJ82_13750 [Gemmataceae bacterium]